jgi:outer membrane lipopolysaccharide assembly protein LptE/RlpB
MSAPQTAPGLPRQTPREYPAPFSTLDSRLSTRRYFSAVLLPLLVIGCGYHLAGTNGLPEDVHSLHVGTITNDSREHGVEKTLAFAFEREIHERGQFRMEQDAGAGDAVLSGTIRDVRFRPVGFDSNDQAVQYEIALIVDLTLTRQRDGRVLWHVKGLRETDEYSASQDVVVTTSSQFQQGTLDAVNLQNPQLGKIQLAETERQRAITRLLRQAVRDVYNQMVEDF